jgi:hypothetical protein
VSPRTPAVRQEWPSGKQPLRFNLEGLVVEVVVDWDYVHDIARQALHNKTGRSHMGPVAARVVKR